MARDRNALRDGMGRRRSAIGQWSVLLGCAAVAMLCIGFIAWYSASQSEPQPPRQASSPPTAPSNSRPPAVSGPTSTRAPAAVEVEDDGKTLWAAPTAGRPLSVRYLPLGTQIVLAVRPAELLRHAESDKLLDAMGSVSRTAIEQLRSAVGIELSKIQHLTIAVFEHEEVGPRLAFVIRTDVPLDFHPQDDGRDWGSYRPEAEPTVLVVAEREALAEIVGLDGQAPLRREIERLASLMDMNRHFVLLANTHYLFDESRQLWLPPWGGLRAQLATIVEEDAAFGLSAHLDESLFLELCTTTTTDQDPGRRAQALANKLDQAMQKAARYAEGQQAESSQPLIGRFPQMAATLRRFTRSGVENGCPEVRAYLPSPAGHNLLLAARLLLARSAADQAATPEIFEKNGGLRRNSW